MSRCLVTLVMLKRVTRSHLIVDDLCKNITKDNTNDSDKTNYTEVKSSQDVESSKVSCDEIKVELRQEMTSKTSAILEKSNLRYYVSHEDTKITNFFLLFTCLLLIVSSFSLLNGNIFLILLNKKAILFRLFVVASLILLGFVYVRRQESLNNLFMWLEKNCNLFEKAVQLSVDVNTINKSYMSKQCLRSRYAKFFASEYAVECVINKARVLYFNVIENQAESQLNNLHV